MGRKDSILVIGDIMLDIYIYGRAMRLSPEAPCPVIDCCESPVYKLGGAANVAYQITQSDLKVTLWGAVGNDNNGVLVKELLADNGITDKVKLSDGTDTTIKTRYLAGNYQQVLRVDNDSKYTSCEEDIISLIQLIQEGNFTSVIISDYSKGIISPKLASDIITECRRNNIPSIIDIKCNALSKSKGASLVKGNRNEFDLLFKEMGLASNLKIETKLSEVCHNLNTNAVVMTCGNDGICAYSLYDGYVKCDADNVPIHDVTGAGDVVTAILGILFSDDSYTFQQKIEFANIAAHKKVSQIGTGTILLDEVINNNKITSPNTIKRLAKGKRIVFTNGCFDVLHAGHVSLLAKAKRQGDILVVGLNSDASVKRLKGEKRPVNSFESRAEVLSSISVVDYIVKFDEDTPLRLIEELNPSVLVKGGDYVKTDIVGYDYVTNNGGNVLVVPFVPHQSSSNILKAIGYE